MAPQEGTGQYQQAVIITLRSLAASPKSRDVLKKKLASKGFPGPVVTRVLDDLAAQGVLDDSVFAKDLVSRLTQTSGAGRFKVAFELKRRGISAQVREKLLSSMTDEDEGARALEQARLKWPGWKRLEPLKRKKRLYDFLIRKGYDFRIAQGVLAQLDRDVFPGDEI
ncbi:MAG: recombination regulator RecX [Candidatus Omnitrophica bacterium]|nr:recombination regulator RecX [Candidatus Omnitrophota bacterium]